jgi:hypothetical protein
MAMSGFTDSATQGLLSPGGRVRKMRVRKEMDRGTGPRPTQRMPLFIITIPLMILAVAFAVIPLLVVSRREHLRHAAEARQLAASVGSRANGGSRRR